MKDIMIAILCSIISGVIVVVWDNMRKSRSDRLHSLWTIYSLLRFYELTGNSKFVNYKQRYNNLCNDRLATTEKYHNDYNIIKENRELYFKNTIFYREMFEDIETIIHYPFTEKVCNGKRRQPNIPDKDHKEHNNRIEKFNVGGYYHIRCSKYIQHHNMRHIISHIILEETL